MGGRTRATEDPPVDGTTLSLGYVSVSIVVVILYYGLQEATIVGNWEKGAQDLSELFLTAACEL